MCAEFDKFHFESLLAYLTDFIWLINDDIDLNIESAFSGILTSEILDICMKSLLLRWDHGLRKTYQLMN